MVEEGDRRGIVCGKDIKQAETPIFSARWGNLLKHFLPESWLECVKM